MVILEIKEKLDGLVGLVGPVGLTGLIGPFAHQGCSIPACRSYRPYRPYHGFRPRLGGLASVSMAPALTAPKGLQGWRLSVLDEPPVLAVPS